MAPLRPFRLLPLLLCAILPLGCASKPTTSAPTVTSAAESPETSAQRDARMAWWRAARFGMFIHWGLYSVPAGTYNGKQIPGIGEWIMNNANIPVAVYAAYAKDFNPEKFDADQWVQIAQDAGMKYIIITAKHHDGFAMFHTAVDSYNIYDATPFHRDPLAELAAACARRGMKLGFYYSQAQDWHHPGGAAIRRAGRKADHWDPAQDGSFDDYLKNVAVPQVRELLTNYGPVSVLWFDTPRQMTPQRVDLFRPLLQLQPDLIVNNRLGPGFRGDTETPEQHIPAGGFPGRDWETCMTINDTWGYKSYDTNFKSPATLLHNLIDIASKGGNYLLNVGPTSEGLIPAPEVDRLQAMGDWLRVNGQAIYGTGPSSIGAGPNWRCTTIPGRLYIHIFQWPAIPSSAPINAPSDLALVLPNIKQTVINAYLLADPTHSPLPFSQENGQLTVHLPPTPPDPIASVLCLEIPTPG